MIVEAHFGFHSVTGGYPVDGSLHLAVAGVGTAPGARIVSAVQLNDLSVIVFNDIRAFDNIGVPQPYFLVGRKAKELLMRHFLEVVLLNIEFAAEGDLAGSHR